MNHSAYRKITKLILKSPSTPRLGEEHDPSTTATTAILARLVRAQAPRVAHRGLTKRVEDIENRTFTYEYLSIIQSIIYNELIVHAIHSTNRTNKC